MNNQQTIERVPDAVVAKRRRPALLRVIGSLFGLSMVAVVAAGAVAGYGYLAFTADGPLAENKVIMIPPGAGRTDISNLLEKEGIIADARVLNGAALLQGLNGAHLKPGEYAFQPRVSMAGVFDMVSKGRVLMHKLTVPEGWTTQMALERVNENDVLTGDPVGTDSLPEGVLVADTMVFTRGMTRQKIVEDMKAMQSKLLEDVWNRRPADFILKSKEELLTLASIVEKETGQPDERPRVAAVFLNRLKAGMRLQSDPTIIYGLVGGVGRLDRPLTRADVAGATAYNTYTIDGLPPGPIASPGRASLEAVIAPAPTKELYFVADGTGGHAFAETLEQHNANVAKWREFQKTGILLPDNAEKAAAPQAAEGGTNATAPAEQDGLPSPDATAPVVDDAAVADAAKTQQAAQGVPEPAEGATNDTGAAQPKAATPPPLPVEKKQNPATKAAQAAATPVKLEPGTVVTINGRAVPVPKLKPARP